MSDFLFYLTISCDWKVKIASMSYVASCISTCFGRGEDLVPWGEMFVTDLILTFFPFVVLFHMLEKRHKLGFQRYE